MAATRGALRTSIYRPREFGDVPAPAAESRASARRSCVTAPRGDAVRLRWGDDVLRLLEGGAERRLAFAPDPDESDLLAEGASDHVG